MLTIGTRKIPVLPFPLIISRLQQIPWGELWAHFYFAEQPPPTTTSQQLIIMDDLTIVIGPHFIRDSDSKPLGADVIETGFRIQFAMPRELFDLPIFCCSKYSGHRAFGFDDYYIRESDLPFEVACWNYQAPNHNGECFIALSAFLAGIYEQFEVTRPHERTLEDFFETIPVQSDFFRQEEDAQRYPLKEHLADAGFVVTGVLPHSRRLLVGMGWRPRRDVQNNKCPFLRINEVEFSPKPDRTLGSGKWVAHRDHRIETMLGEKLRKYSPFAPVDLFTELAKERMLAEFEWTPLALMTSREAREARIQFIRNNQCLVGDFERLACELKKASLYSPETSVYSIRKSLPRLIAAAKG